MRAEEIGEVGELLRGSTIYRTRCSNVDKEQSAQLHLVPWLDSSSNGVATFAIIFKLSSLLFFERVS